MSSKRFVFFVVYITKTTLLNKQSIHSNLRRHNVHDVYNARMAETYLATAIYVLPAAVDTLPLVKT